MVHRALGGALGHLNGLLEISWTTRGRCTAIPVLLQTALKALQSIGKHYWKP